MKIFKRLVALTVALVLLAASLSACTQPNGVKETTHSTTPQIPQQTTPQEENQEMPNIPTEFVEVYETTGTKSSLMQQKDSAPLTAFEGEEENRETVYVDPSKQYQSYIGYGASLTHASAYLLMQADEATRSEILHELFSRDGANLSVVRIPVGASDYIPGSTYFTCDDMPYGKTDPLLENFNLDHDTNIIAVAKEIIKINPNVAFMASPWSAPAWMKTDNQLVSGSGLKSNMYEVYADYLVKFVTEYQKHGISITSLTLVNEPSVGKLSYPTMRMNGQEAAVITAYVGEKFEALGLEVDVVAWDYNYGSSYADSANAYLDTLYKEYAQTAGKYSNTVAFHGYDGDAYWNPINQFGLKNGIQKVSQEYGRASIITEITESDISYDFAGNLAWACQNIVIAPCAVQSDGEGNTWNGCGGALYWNLVLDSNGQPCPADHGACFGVISLDAKTENGVKSYQYSKSSAYYAMAHISKFLYDVDGVGCYAINATTNSNEFVVLAFSRNDGATVIALLNINKTKVKSVDVVIEGKKISYDVQPQSLVTFVVSKEAQSAHSTYHFSNVEMQQGKNDQYQFTFGVDCGTDDVLVYLTERDYFSEFDVAIEAEKTVAQNVATFSFATELEAGGEYFLWVVGKEKEICLPITVPKMNPYFRLNQAGAGAIYFGFANKTSHISFCDRNGKAIYKSDKDFFDSSATPIAQGVMLSAVGYNVPVGLEQNKYYFIVLTAKNGLLTFISQPITQQNT